MQTLHFTKVQQTYNSIKCVAGQGEGPDDSARARVTHEIDLMRRQLPCEPPLHTSQITVLLEIVKQFTSQ